MPRRSLVADTAQPPPAALEHLRSPARQSRQRRFAPNGLVQSVINTWFAAPGANVRRCQVAPEPLSCERRSGQASVRLQEIQASAFLRT